MSGFMKSLRAAFGEVESAPYTVVVEREGYEERVYPRRLWASTSMKGTSHQEVTSPMFRTLFNYISGKNAPNLRIDMTSPVTTYVEPGSEQGSQSTFTMGFLIPGDYQEDPPDPGTKIITVKMRPHLTILTRRFGGYASDEVVAQEKESLEAAIRKGGEEGVNFKEYYVVGYDPPFKLFGRRNEIWFVKAASKEGVGNYTLEEKKELNGEIKEEEKD